MTLGELKLMIGSIPSTYDEFTILRPAKYGFKKLEPCISNGHYDGIGNFDPDVTIDEAKGVGINKCNALAFGITPSYVVNPEDELHFERPNGEIL
jgi:hypothetical protein